MGNFHGVPESCVTVAWREYLPPTVRWRYSGEDWNEIQGDDYQLDQGKWQCSTTYRFFCNFTSYNNFNSPRPESNGVGGLLGAIPQNPIIYIVSKATYGGYVVGDLYVKIFDADNPDGNGHGTFKLNVSTRYLVREIDLNSSRIDWGFQRTDNQLDNCGDCTFKVYLDGEIVHEETREECPEVEVLPCRLSDEIKQIQIQKLPFLERIEIVNETREIIYTPFPLIVDNNTPSECLEIYKTLITAPTGINEFVPLPGAVNPYQHITQICSASGCPPPQYTVIDNCNGDDCKSCPDGTCPIECDDVICCYDEQGIAVKSIPLADYCGD